MLQYKCDCGKVIIKFDYRIHLEGTLTLREYKFKCQGCDKNIEIRDIDEIDLVEQEFLF